MKLKAFKYRIYPNKEQKSLINKTFGCVRFVYNWGLNKRIELYSNSKEKISTIELTNLMASELKKEKEWLNDVPAHPLQMALRNLDSAYTKFFKEKKGFPKYKNKKSKQSYQQPQNTRVDFKNNKINITRLGNVNCIFDRTFEGKIKTSTVSKNKCKQYFISVLVELDENIPLKTKINPETSIGIDLGIKTFATLSNGIKIENPQYYRKLEKKLKKLHKRLSRKKKNSKNKEKTKLKLAKIYNKITNQRNDFLHKLTFKLTHDNQVNTIIMEDLNIMGMLKNHKLSKSISDVSWGEFYRQLQYKCEWYGKNLIKIGRFEPSSQICSECGYRHKELKLSEREWICSKCGTTHDRDENAAKNIKNFGLLDKNIIRSGRPKFTLVEIGSMDDRQENIDLKSIPVIETRSHIDMFITENKL
jgi:putative transposase